MLKFDRITELLAKFPKRFSNYIANPHELDSLEEEYLINQSLGETDIPQYIWYAWIVRLDDKSKLKYHRMDMVWGHVGIKLSMLSDLTLFLLTVPHSNAAEERVFSMISKYKTKFRANLDMASSLNSIMLMKMNQPESLVPVIGGKSTMSC